MYVEDDENLDALLFQIIIIYKIYIFCGGSQNERTKSKDYKFKVYKRSEEDVYNYRYT